MMQAQTTIFNTIKITTYEMSSKVTKGENVRTAGHEFNLKVPNKKFHCVESLIYKNFYS